MRKYFPAYRELWTDKFPEAKLLEIFGRITPYYKSAQFDQEPRYGEMQIFLTDKMPTYQSLQVEANWIAVDAAQTATEHGSYSAFVLLGQFLDQIKVLVVRRARWRQDDLFQNLIEFYNAAAVMTGQYPFKVVVERAAAGFGLIDILSGRLPIEPVIPKGSKEDRAASVAFLVNTGKVALPEEAEWKKAFQYELENFPMCGNSDQVDALVHGLSLIVRPSEFQFQPERQIVEYDTLGNGYQSSFTAENAFDEQFEGWHERNRWRTRL